LVYEKKKEKRRYQGHRVPTGRKKKKQKKEKKETKKKRKKRKKENGGT
jgi:hypothetical protein